MKAQETAASAPPSDSKDGSDRDVPCEDVPDEDILVEHPVERAAPGLSGKQGVHLAKQGSGISAVLPEPGAHIGQYEVIRELGRGGMGAVFLARDTKLGRRVAVKFLKSDQPELTARFILEAKATARCHHENIVVIHDVGESDSNPFMVLEYLEGQELSDVVEPGTKVSPSRAVELIVPVARALVRAHEYNIVHRDLKPANIFVTRSGTVKVLDFGVAKLVQQSAETAGAESGAGPGVRSGAGHSMLLSSALSSEMFASSRASRASAVAAPAGGRAAAARSMMVQSPEAGNTRHGALVGTLPYMSPEQWGADTVDHRTDIWAMGVILCELVTGQHPLAPRKGRALMITGIVDQPMPSVRSLAPDIPDQLARIIDRCLVKPKNQRMGSAQELLDALEPLLPGRRGRALQADQSPYAGLSAFQEADAYRFFGRSREITAAVSRLRDRPLIGVVGPSGVGKSSFVRAGMVPALKQSGEGWTARVVRPGRQPIAALADLVLAVLHESTGSTGGGATADPGEGGGDGDRSASGVATGGSATGVAADLVASDEVLARLRGEPGYLGAVLRSHARKTYRKILLFVDQFEELYTLGTGEDERRAFTASLAGVADDATTPLRVVLSIRSDFLDRVTEDERFMAELAQGLFFLAPPRRDGLREALVQPAELAGYGFESPAMVEHMLEHLEQVPGALPLLQFTASKLWEARDRRKMLLTEASYSALGGIAGALASHADAVIVGFPAHEQRVVRAVFLRLVTAERTRAIVPLDELVQDVMTAATIEPGASGAGPVRDAGGAPEQVISRLVRARLLVVQTGDGARGASVELVHESLIHSWPMLRRWLDETQDDAGFLEQLRGAARQWQARGYPRDLLWRGEMMEDARRWASRYRGQLPELQRAYLHAVFSLAERSERRRRWVLAGAFSVLSLLVVAALVALVIIGEARKAAEEQARIARSAEEDQRQEMIRAKTETARRAEAEEALRRKVAELEAAKARVEKARAEVERANARLARLLAREKRSKRRERRAKRVAEQALAELLEQTRQKDLALAALRAEKEKVQQTLDDLKKARGMEGIEQENIDDISNELPRLEGEGAGRPGERSPEPGGGTQRRPAGRDGEGVTEPGVRSRDRRSAPDTKKRKRKRRR